MGDERPDADAARFSALWQAHAPRVLAYATRHVGADAAQEIVAETFLVAWRRLSDVPGHPLPWLLVVARNTVANHRRSTYRRTLLHGELARLQEIAAPAEAADVTVTDRAEVLAALAAMSAREREALLLVTWDGLTATEAAGVAGCSVSAFHVRLFRARRRLHASSGTDSSGAKADDQSDDLTDTRHRRGAHGASSGAPGDVVRLPHPTRPMISAPRSSR